MSMIQVGLQIPDVVVYEASPENPIWLRTFCRRRKVIIIGAPGAFTPNCSKSHLPGYIEMYEEYKSKGVQEMACISINDAYVMAAWGRDHNVGEKMRMFSDMHGDFTRAIGMELDWTSVVGNVRCRRFTMFVNDGIVTCIESEPDGTSVTCSHAKNFIRHFQQ